MRRNLSLILLWISAAIADQIDTQEEIICTSGKRGKECYPKEFNPSNEWQAIKPGQEVPAGLHIRINMNSSNENPVKEAKLLDPQDVSHDTSHDLQVIDSDPHQPTENDEKEQSRPDIDLIREKVKAFKAKANADNMKEPAPDTTNMMQDAIDTLHLTANADALIEALDNLSDLSHDIEQGEMFTASPDFFRTLMKVAQMPSDAIVERVFRIMGSCLRNNPEATSQTVRNFDSSFFKSLFSQIRKHKRSDVIQKRVLGVILALVQNDHFVYSYFSQDTLLRAFGIDTLVEEYSILGPQSRIRMLRILEALDFVAHDLEVRENNELDADNKVLAFVQSWLLDNPSMPTARIHVYLNALADLHRTNTALRPHQQFLQWISQSAEEGKDRKKRQETSPGRLKLDKLILDVRHEVFGNPMAHRKNFGDEL